MFEHLGRARAREWLRSLTDRERDAVQVFGALVLVVHGLGTEAPPDDIGKAVELWHSTIDKVTG